MQDSYTVLSTVTSRAQIRQVRVVVFLSMVQVNKFVGILASVKSIYCIHEAYKFLEEVNR